MADALKINTIVGMDKVRFDEEDENYILLQLTGKDMDLDKKRVPITILALLDISSSMQPDYKIGYLKKSMVKLIENLRSEDRFCMITYASEAYLLSELSNMDTEAKKKATGLVSVLTAGGMTNMSGALSLAYEQLGEIKNVEENRVIRTILFTDGCPTTGNCNKSILVDMCKSVPLGQITTMGYGKEITDPYGGMTGMSGELDPVLLQGMSDMGKGNYYFMKDPDSCLRAFAYELAGLLSAAAQRVEVQVKGTPNFDIEDVLDDVDFELKDGVATITLPDVIAGEQKAILLKGRTKKQGKAFPRKTKIVDIQILYSDPDGNRVETVEKAQVRFVKDGEQNTELDPEVKTQLAILEAIKAQQDALAQVGLGNFTQAHSMLVSASDALKALGTVSGSTFATGLCRLAEQVKDRESWTAKGGSYTYTTTGRELRTGRASGGFASDLYGTRCQADMSISFSDGIATDDPHPVPADSKADMTNGKASSNKKVRKSKTTRF